MTEFTVRPCARIPVAGDVGVLLERFATALDDDERALGAACAYDFESNTLDAIFQIKVEPFVLPAGSEDSTWEIDASPVGIARRIFDDALIRAFGGAYRTESVAIVEGDDAGQLP